VGMHWGKWAKILGKLEKKNRELGNSTHHATHINYKLPSMTTNYYETERVIF